ncbi:uncharacterized protein IWZ02DRAFT_446983 [Phyllosticta citriasiana]|uniref:uncharacterized protein n=1 Tax=Phyllosticta citriasiana TaxID=595635 RepID=UPI0030FDB627
MSNRKASSAMSLPLHQCSLLPQISPSPPSRAVFGRHAPFCHSGLLARSTRLPLSPSVFSPSPSTCSLPFVHFFFVFVSARPRGTKAEEALETVQGQEGWPLCPFISFPFLLGFDFILLSCFSSLSSSPPLAAPTLIQAFGCNRVAKSLYFYFFFFSFLARVVCRRKAAEIYKKSGLISIAFSTPSATVKCFACDDTPCCSFCI